MNSIKKIGLFISIIATISTLSTIYAQMSDDLDDFRYPQEYRPTFRRSYPAQQTKIQKSYIQPNDVEAYIAQFKKENPRFREASINDIVDQLQEELDQKRTGHPKTDWDRAAKALNLIFEGTCKSTKGIMIIGWISGKYVVSVCGQLFNYAWDHIKQAPDPVAPQNGQTPNL